MFKQNYRGYLVKWLEMGDELFLEFLKTEWTWKSSKEQEFLELIAGFEGWEVIDGNHCK